MASAARTIAIWSPDWPVVTAAAAAGLDPAAPAVVLAAGRVLACTASAREAGVRRGLRRREAQYRCPDLAVLARDLAEEARAFEPIVVVVESLAPGVEIVRPGLCTVSARGPARYFGGDPAAAARLADEASAAGPGDLCRAGVAEGAFAAALAARAGTIVPAGRTPEFLAPYPVDVLDRPDLADLLRRLGLRTLGDFGSLPAADVTARFGADGGFAHRLARGEDPRPPDARTPPPDLVVSTHLDPPAEQVERAAFAARPLADRLHARLVDAGLGCTRLTVEAETEHGERHERVWRYEGVLDAAAIADRVRWQLDGWLTARQTSRQGRPSGGIAVLRLTPDEVIPHGGDQLGLWTHGADAEAADRAARALARVQGMLGQPAVLTAVLAGGRGPGERVRYVAWGDPRKQLEREAAESGPWPGRIPAPSPALVPPAPVPAQLVDDVGLPVAISSRYAISAPPARLRVGEEAPRPVLSWAGPWPAEERWWDAGAAAVKVRVQVATADGAGWLLISQGGQWFVEAVYD
ncbi:MAG TPA: DNA polymerase Y family protein [Sporichthya sp.]|nr:DNA polymerase Y family protein [Sporichthya sp.]